MYLKQDALSAKGREWFSWAKVEDFVGVSDSELDPKERMKSFSGRMANVNVNTVYRGENQEGACLTRLR